MKTLPILGIIIVQIILFLAHFYLYVTWMHFGWPISPYSLNFLRVALSVLSVSFVLASAFAFRLADPLVSLIYRFAVYWLGFLLLLFLAACAAWAFELLIVFLPAALRSDVRANMAATLLVAVLLSGIYGLINAHIIRIRRISIELPNLPAAWRGRKALLLTDLHLGNVNGRVFSFRIYRKARALKPDIVLIAGDLFDGLADKPLTLTKPLFKIKPPLGMFFASGNHDQFGSTARYAKALEMTPLQFLEDRAVVIDGLHLAGVSYERSTSPLALRTFLEGLHLPPDEPSILLNHVPHRLPIVADCGISLQLSGHTHSGQMFPFTFIARRAFGKFTHGFSRLGSLQVYTSSGVGTWGPPMRIGTHSEMVLITFT